MSLLSDFAYLDGSNGADLDGVLSKWFGDVPEGGVLAFVAEADAADVGLLQALCRERAIPLVGAIFPALVVQERFLGRGIVLMRLARTPAYALAEGFETTDGAAAAEAGQRLAEELAGKLSESAQEPLALMIFDGLVPKIAAVLERVYVSLADRVRYLGINAGSETFRPMPCLFDANRLIKGGVLCVLMDELPRMILEHGYPLPETSVAATVTEGNRIVSIDWRPAFDVYRERVRGQYGVDIDHDNFYRYAVHFPFGILRAQGEPLVRIPVALEEDGSLYCIGEVPENAILTLIEAPPLDAMDVSAHMGNRLGGEGGDVLTFYCAGRRLHLGDTAEKELTDLAHATGDARLFGALSLGEIGSPTGSGYPLFHNACLIGARF